MRRCAAVLALSVVLAGSLFADSVMNGLFGAADQVSADLPRILTRPGDLVLGGVNSNQVSIVLGDLFADLVANRLAGRSGFQPQVIKQYSSFQYPAGQATWVLTGALYEAGAGRLLTLQLLDNKTGVQLKGWEFALSNDGISELLKPSVLASVSGNRDRMEPNDNPEEATFVSLPFSEGRFSVSGDDEDWFAFDVPATTGSTVMILDASTGGSTDTYMELFSPDNQQWPVTSNDDTDGGNAVIQIPLGTPGTWYLMVRGYSEDDGGEYSLNISLREGVYGPGEPDESVDRASRLNVGTSPLQKLIDFSSDEDWFRISLVRPPGPGEVLRIDTMGGLDLMMQLLDESGDFIMEDDDSGSGNNPMLMISGLEEGIYYVIVSSFGGETGPYEIMANVTVPARDAFEDDNFMEEASSINADGVAQRRSFSPMEDIDWVAFNIAVPGNYRIETRGDIDTYMELYDDQGNLIDENDDGDDQNAMISRNLRAGSYYISVYPYGPASPDDPYELSVTPLR